MGLSIWHILIVLLVVLIVFGAGKLPQIMGDLGKGIKSFKSGLDDATKPEPPQLPPADTDKVSMLDIAWPELIVIGAVALVAIGPKDLPKVMRVLGQWAGKARNVVHELQRNFEQLSYEAEVAE